MQRELLREAASTDTCEACGHRSIKFDPFMYLSLPLDPPPGGGGGGGARGARDGGAHGGARRGLALDELFAWFQAEERLDGDDKWYCGKCKAHVCARKQIALWKLPQILIVHLKRFSVNAWGEPGRKRNDLVAPAGAAPGEPGYTGIRAHVKFNGLFHLV